MNDFKLKLKSIRYNPLLARGSHYYTATVHLNGKAAAFIESDGGGGDPYISFTDQTTQQVIINHFRNQPRKQVADYDYYYQPNLGNWANAEINLWLKKRSAKQARLLPSKSASEYRVVD